MFLTANDWCRNEFSIPDMPHKPCLLLCPHINLLTLIFTDQAFAPPDLNSPKQFFRLRIEPGQKQLEIPLKENMQNVPLFRWSEDTVNRVQISNGKALPDSTLRSRMVTLGNVTGMKLPTGLYTFWCGNSEALDTSSE